MRGTKSSEVVGITMKEQNIDLIASYFRECLHELMFKTHRWVGKHTEILNLTQNFNARNLGEFFPFLLGPTGQRSQNSILK